VEVKEALCAIERQLQLFGIRGCLLSVCVSENNRREWRWRAADLWAGVELIYYAEEAVACGSADRGV
jgi:hypothetical protein